MSGEASRKSSLIKGEPDALLLKQCQFELKFQLLRGRFDALEAAQWAPGLFGLSVRRYDDINKKKKKKSRNVREQVNRSKKQTEKSTKEWNRW